MLNFGSRPDPGFRSGRDSH